MKNSLRYNLLTLFILTPLFGHAAAYIKFDGIDGESRDKDHKGWIDLHSISTRTGNQEGWTDLHSFSQVAPRDVASGRPTGKREPASGLATGKRDAASGLATGKRDAASGMASGKRQHKPIRITKEIDKATPLLAKAMQTGSSIGNVSIQRVENGQSETFTLVNVTIAAIEKQGRKENVTFSYENIAPAQVSNPQVRGWDPKKKEAIAGTARTK